jgi:hypothetical protein
LLGTLHCSALFALFHAQYEVAAVEFPSISIGIGAALAGTVRRALPGALTKLAALAVVANKVANNNVVFVAGAAYPAEISAPVQLLQPLTTMHWLARSQLVRPWLLLLLFRRRCLPS